MRTPYEPELHVLTRLAIIASALSQGYFNVKRPDDNYLLHLAHDERVAQWLKDFARMGLLDDAPESVREIIMRELGE